MSRLSPKTSFEWVDEEPDAASVEELARFLRKSDTSLAEVKERKLLEFRGQANRHRTRSLLGLLGYLVYVAVALPLFRMGAEVSELIPIVLALSFAPIAFYMIGRPLFAWIGDRGRIRSLLLADSAHGFLSRAQRERLPFVFYLRDFRSWSGPHFVSGALMSTDPLVRELSWVLPEGVVLVCMHNPSEKATRTPKVKHLLSADEAWEETARFLCALAALIVVAPRDVGTSLKREIGWIRDSEALRRKTLLLYDPMDPARAESLQVFVRWSEPLWRPPTGENITGLAKLPETLELVRYSSA